MTLLDELMSAEELDQLSPLLRALAVEGRRLRGAAEEMAEQDAADLYVDDDEAEGTPELAQPLAAQDHTQPCVVFGNASYRVELQASDAGWTGRLLAGRPGVSLQNYAGLEPLGRAPVLLSLHALPPFLLLLDRDGQPQLLELVAPGPSEPGR